MFAWGPKSDVLPWAPNCAVFEDADAGDDTGDAKVLTNDGTTSGDLPW